MRLDLLLVKWGMAPSRSKAQELIRHGEVEIQRRGKWEIIHAPSFKLDSANPSEVRVRPGPILQYVSRGGMKLAGALDRLQFDVNGLVVLDVGISTGGFADCLLQKGAKEVIGIDVGTGQLAEKLRNDPRVILFENRNIRDLSKDREMHPRLQHVELCVVDVSFISLEYVLPQVSRILPRHKLLALIKPQFELTQEALNKKGVVKSEADLEAAKQRVKACATAAGYKILDVFPSGLLGGEGNQEFFLWAERWVG